MTVVCPGIIDTPITGSTRLRGPVMNRPGERTRMIEIYRRRNYGPERVAVKILRAVQRNRGVAPISPEAWLLYYLKRLAPGPLARVGRLLSDRRRRRMGLGG